MKIIKTIPFNSKTTYATNPDFVRVYVDMTNEEFEDFKESILEKCDNKKCDEYNEYYDNNCSAKTKIKDCAHR